MKEDMQRDLAACLPPDYFLRLTSPRLTRAPYAGAAALLFFFVMPLLLRAYVFADVASARHAARRGAFFRAHA